MFAADDRNVYKIFALSQIAPTTMADLLATGYAELSSQISKEDMEMPYFDLLVGISPEPPAKRFASLTESQLDDLVSEKHSKKTKEVTHWSTFKAK